MAAVLESHRPASTNRGGLDDRQLGTAITAALARTRLAPGSTVWATVYHAHVTLNGDVDSWTQRDAVEHSMRRVAGMRSLRNLVKVNTEVTAKEVKQAIADAYGSPG